MGSDIDPNLLIRKIDNDFGFRLAREAAIIAEDERKKFDQLAREVRELDYYASAWKIAELKGFRPVEVGGGLFTMPAIHVPVDATSDVLLFKNQREFIQWVKQSLCSAG